MDELRFGMTQSEVIAKIGDPDLILVDEDDEDKNPVYQYTASKLRLTFYTEYNLRFGYIRTSNVQCELNGSRLVDESTDRVIEAYNRPKNEWDMDSYFSFNTYFNQNIWTTLHEEYGVITNVEFGFLFDTEGENPMWPTEK